MLTRDKFQVGYAFTLAHYKTVWVVRQIVERGVVVSTKDKDDHRHLLDWSQLTSANEKP